MRLSVLHLINGYHVGGDNTLACNIASGLSNKDFQPHVCAMFQDNDPATASRFQAQLALAGVDMHRLEKVRHRKSLGVLLRLRRLVHELGVHIIHSHGNSPDLHAAIAMAGSASPILIRTLHSTDFDFHFGHKAMERVLRGRFSASVAISPGVRDWALAFGLSPNSLQIIENGIQLGDSRPLPVTRESLGLEALDDCHLLVSVGRMEEDRVKGHEYLLEAMSLLAGRGRRFHLLMVGDGALRPQYEARCRQPDLAGRVTFLGRRQDVAAILGACGIFVTAAVREGFGLAVCEAGAAGLPVIATDIPGLDGVIQHGVDGLLVPPRAPEALAQAVERLLDDPLGAQTLARTLEQKVRTRFTLARVVEEHAALYQRLARERRIL